MIGPVFGKSDPSATAHAELIEYNVAVNTRIALFFFFFGFSVFVRSSRSSGGGNEMNKMVQQFVFE